MLGVSIVRSTCCGVHASTRRLSSIGGREAESENPIDNDRSRYDDDGSTHVQ